MAEEFNSTEHKVMHCFANENNKDHQAHLEELSKQTPGLQPGRFWFGT
jgi:hypothetical protein